MKKLFAIVLLVLSTNLLTMERASKEHKDHKKTDNRIKELMKERKKSSQSACLPYLNMLAMYLTACVNTK